MEYWAIRYIPQPHKFLPGYEGRGHTWREPTSSYIINPRLFMSRAAASRALSAWVKGRHGIRTETDDDFFGNPVTVAAGVQAEPVAGRNRADFEIVKVQLTLASDPST